MAFAFPATAPPADAQSITAASDGTGTLITLEGNTYQIQGGTQAGANLFHSFQNFGLSSGEIANFLSSPNIIHILGRVTSGEPSLINGLMQVTGAHASLYLMNPAGLLFGPEASLNVRGDFVGTTADRVGFEHGWLNASGVNDYTALVGPPQQFAFLQSQPGAILNQGALQADGNLSLLGGAIHNSGSIISTQGTVTLAAVPGTRLVNLAQPGMLLSLDLPQADVSQGISPLEVPALLTGPTADTSVQDLSLTGVVRGQQIDLYGSGPVSLADPALIQGDTRVVRFSASGENPNQAVFVDRRADHPEALLFGTAPGTVSQIIERDENGIIAIAEQLSLIHDAIGALEGVAIAAEGNTGNIWLGNQWLHHGNLSNHAPHLRAWGTALTDNADLLLYSCFTALGAAGEQFVQSLADLTGADVAASVNLTGSAQYGGDWVLEHTLGELNGLSPWQTSTLAAWEGKLISHTVTSLLDDNSGGTLREAIAAASANELITFGTIGTVKLNGTEIDWSTDNLTIDGNGAIVDGQLTSRVFRIRAANATLQNLTIQRGAVNSGGAGIGYTGSGTLNLNTVKILDNRVNKRAAGVRSTDGLVVLRNSLVSGNSAGLGRGGVSVDNNDLIVINSTITNNSAGTSSGGIRADNITVIDSTITNNAAGSTGGGIHHPDALGSVTVTNSTVAQNTAGTHGGGINAAGVVEVTNSTITNNSASGYGGGIRTTDALKLVGSTITHNSAAIHGGGVNVTKTLTLNDSTIAQNFASNSGGGVYASDVTELTDSTIADNIANLYGGGIFAQDTITLSRATVSGNFASNAGGGLYAKGAARLFNSTISGNSTNAQGGGLFAASPVTLTHATIAFNTATNGGGGVRLAGLEINQIHNTIIAHNFDTNAGTAPDIRANLSSSTVQHSLLTNASGITGLTLADGVDGNIIGQDPLLDPLLDNGGSTATHALRSGSPAIDTGDNALALDANGLPLAITQTGEPRNLSTPLDMGAYEFGVLTTPSAAPSTVSHLPPTTTPSTTPHAISITRPSTPRDSIPSPTLPKTKTTAVSSCGWSCQPYRTLPVLDPSLGSKTARLLALEVEGVEVKMTNDYATLILENDDIKPLTIAQAQTLMQDIEQQTGVRPAALYLSFVPPLSVPPAGTVTNATPTPDSLTPPDLTVSVPGNPPHPPWDTIFPVGLTSFPETRSTFSPAVQPVSLPPQNPASDRNHASSLDSGSDGREHSEQDDNHDDAQLQLILVPPDGSPIVRHPLGVTRSQVMQSAQEFRMGLNAVVGTLYVPPAQQLYDWLIRPLQDTLQTLEIEHLAIVAAAGLRSLPLAALHDGERFLIEDYSVGLMPSLSLVDWQYQPLHNAAILAMGASEFEKQPPLPAVPIELSLITENSHQKYLNDSFTYANLKTQAKQRQFQILHLATHAQFRQGSADAAFIQLWGQDDVQLKGLREFQLHQDPALELLVLSACDTAVGDATAELGFAGAAVQAGVKSVLASLWQVSDVGTLALMNTFYSQLADPDVAIKAEALRQAQLGLLRGDISVQQGSLAGLVLPPDLADYLNTDLTHPYYWSAFTLVGSPW